MNLLESYDKNKKKHLLREVTAGGSVGAFVGTGGQTIDALFAGPYHPDFGEIGKLLKKQLEYRFELSDWNRGITPELEQLFKYLDIDYHYDKLPTEEDIQKMKKFINTTGKMQPVDIEINYDKIIDKTEENKKFINPTNDWKSIYDSKKY